MSCPPSLAGVGAGLARPFFCRCVIPSAARNLLLSPSSLCTLCLCAPCVKSLSFTSQSPSASMPTSSPGSSALAPATRPASTPSSAKPCTAHVPPHTAPPTHAQKSPTNPARCHHPRGTLLVCRLVETVACHLFHDDLSLRLLQEQDAHPRQPNSFRLR